MVLCNQESRTNFLNSNSSRPKLKILDQRQDLEETLGVEISNSLLAHSQTRRKTRARPKGLHQEHSPLRNSRNVRNAQTFSQTRQASPLRLTAISAEQFFSPFLPPTDRFSLATELWNRTKLQRLLPKSPRDHAQFLPTTISTGFGSPRILSARNSIATTLGTHFSAHNTH